MSDFNYNLVTEKLTGDGSKWEEATSEWVTEMSQKPHWRGVCSIRLEVALVLDGSLSEEDASAMMNEFRSSLTNSQIALERVEP